MGGPQILCENGEGLVMYLSNFETIVIRLSSLDDIARLTVKCRQCVASIIRGWGLPMLDCKALYQYVIDVCCVHTVI